MGHTGCEILGILISSFLLLFAVALVLCFYIITCSLVGFMSEGKGWRRRHDNNVAPVSSHEGFSFTFPSSRGLCQSLNPFFKKTKN